LWEVADESTAELMHRLYRGIRDGLDRDEALRSAQLELLRAPLELADGRVLDARHPYFWAPFELNGAWR
jgi:CHAT domain-containing protein